MERDDPENLDDLLRRADGVAGAPRPAVDVAGRVRRRHVRRRRVRAVVGSAAVAVCVAVGVWQIGVSVRTGAGPESPHVNVAVREAVDVAASQPVDVAVRERVDGVASQPVDVAAIRSELEALRRETERHEAAAARMLAHEQRRKRSSAARRRLAAEPAIDLAWQREQAALVLVRQGDRLAQELNLPEPAALAYRQASETFPGTHWGGVARERLTRSN